MLLNGWLRHLEIWSVHVSSLLWDFSARWFVPWLCLPHVYNYRRFLQAEGHRGISDRHLEQTDIKYIKILTLKFSKTPLI